MVSDIGTGDIVVGTCGSVKGKYFRIIAFGEHTETGEREVVYQALYPPFGTWIMPYDLFMGEADHVKQKYRFEVVTKVELAKVASNERLSCFGI